MVLLFVYAGIISQSGSLGILSFFKLAPDLYYAEQSGPQRRKAAPRIGTRLQIIRYPTPLKGELSAQLTEGFTFCAR